MKQPWIQVLVIVSVFGLVLLVFLMRSTLGLTTPESLQGVSQVASLALMFVLFNLVAGKIFKPQDDGNNMVLYIGCAVLSALLTFIFHAQIDVLWQFLFRLVPGKQATL